MKIDFSKKFKKKYKKLKLGERRKFEQRLELFEKDPHNSILNNHALQHPYLGFRSIDITGDLRVHYEQIDESTVLFITIGTHSELYG